MFEPEGGWKDEGGSSNRYSSSYYDSMNRGTAQQWISPACMCTPCKKVRKWTILQKEQH